MNNDMHDQQLDLTQERLITIAEAARMLSVSTRGFYRLIASGELPSPLKVGTSSRIPITELNAYIQRLKDRRH